MARSSITVKVKIEGVRETLRAISKLPKDASAAIRDRAGKIAQRLAAVATAEGKATGRQAAAVADTVKVARDRLPAVQAGGARRITGSRVPAWQLLWGSIFGANGRYGWYAETRYAGSEGRQFLPHTGREGMWFFPAVEAEQSYIEAQWNAAAADVIREFGEGGNGGR